MKKLLKSLGVLAIVLIAAFVILRIIAGGEKRTLKAQGFSEEEIELISKIEYRQRAVNSAAGKSTKFISWGHLTELYDDDGTTLLGYYIDGKTEGAAIGKRYYFTKDKELLWWTNQTPEADDQGRQHLKSREGW